MGGNTGARLSQLEAALAALEREDLEDGRVAVRLQTFLAGWKKRRLGELGETADVAEQIESASDEEIFRFIDEELGDRGTAGAGLAESGGRRGDLGVSLRSRLEHRAPL